MNKNLKKKKIHQNNTQSLSSIGEQKFVNTIKGWVKKRDDKCVVGIGDDTAVVNVGTKKCLVTTDALIEHVHFTRNISSWYDVGWKSLAVNISDIASMGGCPQFALITFGVTPDLTIKNLKDFYRGFSALAEKTGVHLIGGDTVKSRRDVFISVTAIGIQNEKKAVLRNGAKPGDLICVTGTFGDAAKGLKDLLKGNKNSYFTKKFNRPMPRWKEGIALAKHQIVNAMMDCSDGLALCVHELMQQSKTGCEIWIDKIPISKQLKKLFPKAAINHALYGGEDYELVFTVPEKKLPLVKKIIPNSSVIGSVTKTKKNYLIDEKGTKKVLPRKGYDALLIKN